ncbi:hypothetical protein [Massilicoli timonensis]|uniref:hypothetical protein n=1 Tax=Massilicoli timonensis TaxID=2015901 RepID=UPI000C848C24|nr:hypothetical protein [Massilicoli timonensis]
MRKSIGLIVLACLLCACSGTQRYDEEAQEKYQEYVAAIAANKGAESSDIPFAHDITMEKETDGYAYEITIKEPITAMYQIEFMAVDGEQIKADDVTHPSLGILDSDEVYHMVPYQEDKEKGFYRSLSLKGKVKKSEGSLYVMVAWKDYAKLNTHRVYFTYAYQNDEAQEKEE